MSGHLPGVFGAVAPFVEHYGYLAVALLVLLENLGLVIPGEAALVTGAVFAAAGRLDLTVLAVVAVTAAVAGDNLGYALGRWGGRALVLRLGRRLGLTSARLAHVEGFFVRYGVALVVVARFLPVLRHGNGIAAGTSAMPWRRFLLGNALGAGLWTTVWVLVGRAGADHLTGLDEGMRVAAPVIGALLLLGVLLALLRRRRGRRTAPVLLATETP